MYRYPLGVVGGITPFNFPMMVPCWMFPLAIACGNTFVLKPSERTPLLANRLAELLHEAGLPDGVLNIVHGAHDVVNGLLVHPDVQAISFVGSQPVAEYVYKTAAAHGKRVQALAGAKNHSIVMPDADLDLAVKEIINAAFGSAGERCMACSVVVAVGDIAEPLVDKLRKRRTASSIGNGLDEGVFLGPVIRERAQGKDDQLYRNRRAGRRGAACGTAATMRQRRATGYFVGPTIFDHVTTEMTIWQDEIFAPVLSIVRCDSLGGGDRDRQPVASSRTAPVCYTDSGSRRPPVPRDDRCGHARRQLGVPAPMAFFPFSGWKNRSTAIFMPTARTASNSTRAKK